MPSTSTAVYTEQTDEEFLATDQRVRESVVKIDRLWFDVAIDLHRIRMGGALERHGYPSFLAYIQSVRDLSPSYARRLMASAEVILEAVGYDLPERPVGRPSETAPTGRGFAYKLDSRTVQVPPTVTERSVREATRVLGRAGAVTRVREHLHEPWGTPLVPPKEPAPPEPKATDSDLLALLAKDPLTVAASVPDDQVLEMVNRVGTWSADLVSHLARRASSPEVVEDRPGQDRQGDDNHDHGEATVTHA